MIRRLTSIAVYRDEEKLHTYRGPGASKSSIDIYSCAGKLIRSINVCNPLHVPGDEGRNTDRR